MAQETDYAVKETAIKNKFNYLYNEYKDTHEKELKKNYIVIKNGSFNISVNQKKALEQKLEHRLKKSSFSSKNPFLYNYAKTELEKLDFSFITETDLETRLETDLKLKKQELDQEQDQELEKLKQEKELEQKKAQEKEQKKEQKKN